MSWLNGGRTRITAKTVMPRAVKTKPVSSFRTLKHTPIQRNCGGSVWRWKRRHLFQFVTLHYPGFVEDRVLHAFAFTDKVAIDDMNHARAIDDHSWVVVASFGLAFQVPCPFPRLAFILRNGHRQAIASADGIVVNQHPIPVGK